MIPKPPACATDSSVAGKMTLLAALAISVAKPSAFTTSCKNYVSTYSCSDRTTSDNYYNAIPSGSAGAKFDWGYLLSDKNWADESDIGDG